MKTLFLTTVIYFIYFLRIAHGESNPCVVNEDCGSCLRANVRCAFCKDASFSSTIPRCNYAKNLKDLGCKDLMDKKGEYTVVSNGTFSTHRQVDPQKIALTLRPGETLTFKIQVKPAVDFPVDLYYLMDMSKSMEDDLLKLRKLGTKIADEIGQVTTKYRLAFGSFVDKTVAPFIQPSKLNEPCRLNDGVTPCVPTFGYKHIFDFNNDKNQFQVPLPGAWVAVLLEVYPEVQDREEKVSHVWDTGPIWNKVNEQKISGNLDTPEGGFDALMQVASCNNTLKWKAVELAHRIIVFVTDASPHIAGDGKLGGIIAPNDGACHLNPSDATNPKLYTKSNTMDYPSISKLKSKLKENDIIPIFAVTENVEQVYKKITSEWKDLNAALGILEDDSSNIVDLIREKYSEIIKTIRMSDNSPSDIHVKYKVDSTCATPIEKGSVCTNITAGEVYGFDVLVTAGECPKNKKNALRSFTINVPGLGKIAVDVNLTCECKCESMGVINSTFCNGNGTYQCGICQCNPGYFGEYCMCTEASEADDTQCKQTNSTNPDFICSGAGSCICGKCACNKRLNPGEMISGRFCECNNYGCDRFQNKICGGPDHGTCECGICKCKEGYIGDNCGGVNCTASETKCLDSNGINCGGHGVCDCDRCVCEKGYVGSHCEECVSCQKCSKYNDCIQCVLEKTGPLVSTNCTSCSYLDIQLADKEIQGYCRYQIDENCFYEYDFMKGKSSKETIYVKKDCVINDEKSIPILYIIIGIIGGIIFLAFLLLIAWKITITLYDIYEYKQFIKNKPVFPTKNENQIYIKPTTTFDNPTYLNNPYA